MAWNMLVKRVTGKEYLIHSFMATTLDESTFNKMKAINPETLSDYYFIPQSETDFSWWSKCFKKLTRTKIVQADFDIDWNGKVTEVK